MTDKELYIQFSEERKNIPLSLQSWWMEAVACDNEWNVLIKKDNNGQIIAFLPYMLTQKFGLNIVIQPNLAQTNGIWIDPQHAHSEDVYTFFIEQLNQLHLDWFLQNFPFDFVGQQPFIEHGYRVTQRRTFIIHNLEREEQEIFKHIHTTKSRQIRKAYKEGLTIAEEYDSKAFVDFHNYCLECRGEKNHNSLQAESKLIQDAIDREQGTLLYVVNQEGKKIAALFLVWDSDTAYYLIPTYDPQHTTAGASAFMVWEAILYAKRRGLSNFDFEGGNDPSIGRFYEQFGGEIQYYSQIEKVNSWLLQLYKKWRKR